MPLIKSIQELSDEVDKLKAEIEELKKINYIKNKP